MTFSRSRAVRTAVALCGLLALAGPAGPAAAQAVFASRTGSVGVEVDTGGNLYLQWNTGTSDALTRFAPDGTPVAEVPFGSDQVGLFEGRVARVPGSDVMLLMSSTGVIYAFGPDLQPAPFLDLGVFAFQVAPGVLDVTFNQVADFSLGDPYWGDIAAFVTGPNLLRLYVAATSEGAGTFPFVLRLDLDFAVGQLTWRVVAYGSGVTEDTLGLARGVAVNPQGWVLTAFPFPVPDGGFADSLVAFNVGYPEVADASTAPRFILPDPAAPGGIRDVAARGMAADALGNFYVATGLDGSTLCGGPGLLLVGPDPTQPTAACVPVPSLLTTLCDVAVSPIDLSPYLTVNENDVLRFPALATAPPALAATGGARAPAGSLLTDKRKWLAFRYAVPRRG